MAPSHFAARKSTSLTVDQKQTLLLVLTIVFAIFCGILLVLVIYLSRQKCLMQKQSERDKARSSRRQGHKASLAQRSTDAVTLFESHTAVSQKSFPRELQPSTSHDLVLVTMMQQQHEARPSQRALPETPPETAEKRRFGDSEVLGPYARRQSTASRLEVGQTSDPRHARNSSSSKNNTLMGDEPSHSGSGPAQDHTRDIDGTSLRISSPSPQLMAAGEGLPSRSPSPVICDASEVRILRRKKGVLLDVRPRSADRDEGDSVTDKEENPTLDSDESQGRL
jgi:hypothetical protein